MKCCLFLALHSAGFLWAGGLASNEHWLGVGDQSGGIVHGVDHAERTRADGWRGALSRGPEESKPGSASPRATARPGTAPASSCPASTPTRGERREVFRVAPGLPWQALGTRRARAAAVLGRIAQRATPKRRPNSRKDGREHRESRLEPRPLRRKKGASTRPPPASRRPCGKPLSCPPQSARGGSSSRPCGGPRRAGGGRLCPSTNDRGPPVPRYD